MTNLDSILKAEMSLCKQSYTKGVVKAMVFSVVMYSCESWTTKKAERRRTDAGEDS